MKKVLFGSVVAAVLIFSGCGSSSSNGGNNNQTQGGGNNNQTQGGGDNSQTQGGGDNNQTQGGGDNNQTQGGGDNNQTQGGGDATTTTFNGLSWTALVPYDDNATKSGKITYSEAEAKCQELGMSLPTESQIDVNTSALKADVNFNFENAVNSNGGTALIVWLKDEGVGQKKGYAFDKSGDDYVYTNDAPWTNTDTNFVTCVK
jgi:hypothetical protein